MAKIRDDFEGAVHVDGFVLMAGDEVPDGVRVGSHLTGVEPEPVSDGAGDDFDPLADEPGDEVPEPAKPRGRPKKAE